MVGCYVRAEKREGGIDDRFFLHVPFYFLVFIREEMREGKKKISFIVRKNPLLFNVCNRRKTIGRHINMYTHMKREVLNFFCVPL